MKKRVLMLAKEEGRDLIKMIKKVLDCGDFEMPEIGRPEYVDAELIDMTHDHRKMYFEFDKGNEDKFQLSLGIQYYKVILCRLHTNQKHRNRDGSIINGSHLHLYEEGRPKCDAIEFSSLLRDHKELGSCIIDFLKYCEVTNIEDLAIQSELGLI